MKNVIVTGLFLLAQCAAFAQQSVLNGTVTVFNSQFETGKKQYVANAQVEEDYGKSQATTTNTEGVFKLPLVGIKDLEKVFFNVKKTNYEVVNTDVLQAVAGQKESTQVFMALEGAIAENKRKYYQINRTASEKVVTEKLVQLGQQIETLQQNKEANKTKIEDLQAEYARLQERFKKIDETAKELADRYAKINLDDQSKEYQNAFRFFQAGQLEEALKVLQMVDLEKMGKAITQEQERNQKLNKEYEERDSLKNVQKKQVTEGLLFKARLHETKFEFPKVEACFTLLLKLDTSNITTLRSYADFLYTQNEKQKSIIYLQKALALSDDGNETATLCTNIGVAYADLNNIQEAEKYLREAMDTRQFISVTHYLQYQAEMASLRTVLGTFYAKSNQKNKAEKYLLEALAIIEPLYKNNPVVYESEFAKITADLGAFYNDLDALITDPNEMAKAEKLSLQSLALYEHLSATNPQEFEPHLATITMILGAFYHKNKQLPEVEKYYLQSLKIYDRLSKNNPQQFEPDLATIAMDLGVLYHNKEQTTEAEEYYLQSLKIREHLCETNPQQYGPDLAMTVMNLGNFYSSLEQTNKAEKYYLQSLAICKGLSQTNRQVIEPDWAKTEMNVGIFYAESNKLYDAEKHMLEALSLYQSLSQNDPKRFGSDLARTLTTLTNVYEATNRMPEAEKYLLQALEVRENLMTIIPKETELYLAKTESKLGEFYDKLNRKREAEKHLLKAFGLYEHLSQIKPQENEIKLAIAAGDLGNYYKTLYKMPEAEKYYLKALEIWERLAQSNPEKFEYGFAATVGNLGSLYSALYKIPEAEKYLLQAFEIFDRLSEADPQEFKNDLAIAAEDLGNFYTMVDKLDEAELMQLKALKFWQELDKSNSTKYKKDLANCLNDLGFTYVKMKDFEQAKNYIEQSYKLKPDNSFIFRNWACLYALKGDNQQAIDNLNKAANIDFGEPEWIEREKSLSSIRNHPQYLSILDKMKVNKQAFQKR
jgi:tetratricopeptide (TPR) repeat protein